MKRLILDTNALLRYLVNDTPSQAEKTEAIMRLAKEGKVRAVILNVVVLELLFALSKFYKWDRELISENLKKMVMSPLLDVERREVVVEALSLYSEDGVSFADCLLLAETGSQKAELFTFDEKLKRKMKK